MSIKGGFQELYVGKKESNLIGILGSKRKIDYSDLSSIDYCLSQFGIGGGYLNFNGKNGKTVRFEFGSRVNNKIKKMVELVEENNPDLIIKEHLTKDIKFYQADWFMILASFCCCFPLGLFIMWYYKKFNKVARIFITSFLLLMWSYSIYASYSYYTSILEEINNTVENIYSDSSFNNQEVTPAVNNNETVKTEAFSTTLITGHYLVGTDIPVGTYNFFSKKGSGNLFSSDGTVNVIFDHNNESGKSIGLETFGTEELKGIYLSEGTIISVTGAQEISAGCDDGAVSSMKERDQEDIDEIEIGYGHFGAPDNIPSGTYNVELLEGKGNIICSSSTDTGINEVMGEVDSDNGIEEKIYITEFKNLTIEDGDILEIDNIKIKLTPSK